jgi:hypothetical protein
MLSKGGRLSFRVCKNFDSDFSDNASMSVAIFGAQVISLFAGLRSPTGRRIIHGETVRILACGAVFLNGRQTGGMARIQYDAPSRRSDFVKSD